MRLAPVLVVLSGCGGPAAPSTHRPAPLAAATYLLHITADGIGCRDPVNPTITSLDARPLFTLDGNVWVGRPGLGGHFELRIERSAQAARTPLSRTPVAGTLMGFVRDEGDPSPGPGRGPIPLPPAAPRDVQFEAATSRSLSLEGAIDNDGRVGEGRILSAAVFRSSTRSVSCAPGTVRWALFQAGPG